MNTYFSSTFKLGVLGGGQLGKMLLAETQKWDVYTIVLDSSEEAPCAAHCNAFYRGNLADFDTVYNFGKKVDILTIEIEHVNIEALYKLEQEGVKVFPQPRVIEIIQHKGKQKDFYQANNIPTSAYQRFDSLEALKVAGIPFPFVWKSARFGYDGTGVKIVKNEEDLNKLSDVDCIVEDFIPFKNELAVIVARNECGEIKTYPVVEMEFHPEANQVEYVICPARISDELAEKANKVALQVAQSFKHVGLLAVELFQTETDEIIVNEVAPRTHNSGHFSIEASLTSQFEQHLRAILNLPLGNTTSKLAAVMVNLVGAEGFSGNAVYKNIEAVLKISGVTPHIYGKKQTKPFRKMGHVTVVDDDVEQARSVAEVVKNSIKVVSAN